MTIQTRRLSAAEALVAVAMALAPIVANAQTAVVGRNDPAVDVPAVQAAVDLGGSVQLVGTFDLGDAGRVTLVRDVEISGEAGTGTGVPLTTIRRGQWSFHTPYPSSLPLPPAEPGPKVAIHHLHFVESRGTAIHLAYSGGALLHHNVIEGMRARVTSAGTQERAAIVVGPGVLGNVSKRDPQGRLVPNSNFVARLVSGDIQVSDNVIDTSGPEPTDVVRGTGMFVSMYVGADVRIERNVVTGNTRTGLAILDGKADDSGRGSVVIADNSIASDVRVGFTAGAGPRAPIGIVTGFNNQRALGADPDLAMIPALIDRNHIELRGVAPRDRVPTPSMGIVNIWNGAILTGNTIVVENESASTTNRLSTSGGILAATSHQVLMHNRIIGTGCNAIRIGGTDEKQFRFGNVAIGNNISGFSAFAGGIGKCADYWLEGLQGPPPTTHDNTIVGNSGSVIDDGVDDKITGLRPVKGGVGGAVSAAAQDAADVTHDLGFGFVE